MKKILIMGLPGSGKTTFAQELRRQLQNKKKSVVWYNADIIRKLDNNWDFSHEGRIKQAKKMKHLADTVMTDYVICDFVAPLKEMRDIFEADYVVWMDTISEGRFEDTNKIFEVPLMCHTVKVKDCENTVKAFLKDILQLK